jgi:rapamycin-insensitive companion of mTOR
MAELCCRTCFFVIGLIASTEQGAEILSDYGWLAATTALGEPTGMCVPEDISKFMTVSLSLDRKLTTLMDDQLIPWETPNLLDSDRRLPPLKSQHERDVLEAIENLCNTVVANAASRTLAKFKSRTDTRTIFSSSILLHRALHAISTRRYRFPVRRYILELFDIKFSSSTLEELAQHERQALEELKVGGAGFLSQRHVHGHGHHSNGARKLRHSIRAKARRRSDADFRNVGGQANDAHYWNSAGVPDSPVVIRAKPNVPKMVGFDAILDDTATPIIVQGS